LILQLRQEVSKIVSQKISQEWWFTSVIPTTWEVEVKVSCLWGSGKNTRSYLKNKLKAKDGDGNMAQV
jgi:hypothetical protein